MEHPPRFDTSDRDPTCLKPNLARLANATLAGLWINSPLQDRITIGQHSLESSGAGTAHLNRYQNQTSGKYDGVHLYGKTGCTDYTNSVKTILMMAVPKRNLNKTPAELGTAQPVNHNDCPQVKYQKKQ